MRYFVGFLITLGLIILLIFLIFHGGGKPKVQPTQKTLVSYASTDAQVRLTIDGSVNADQTHNAIRITVDNSEITYEQIQGYQGSVVSQQHFANNGSAYATFLQALAHAGFTKGNTDKALQDERGYCPIGNRYIFDLSQSDETIERFWGTSCGNPKTYQGNLNLTVALFKAQVPNYGDLVENVKL